MKLFDPPLIIFLYHPPIKELTDVIILPEIHHQINAFSDQSIIFFAPPTMEAKLAYNILLLFHHTILLRLHFDGIFVSILLISHPMIFECVDHDMTLPLHHQIKS